MAGKSSSVSEESQESSGEVRVLARGLAILRAFEPENPWLSNTDIADLTGLPKPTVSRITANLTVAGYLNYSAGKAAYRLSTSVLSLGFVAASNRNLVLLAKPLMQAFADRHKVSVVLASLDSGSMVCSEVVHARNMLFALRLRAGSRLQVGQSALGRAFVGSMGETERERFLSKLSRTDPEVWETVQKQAKAVISQMKRKQYCVAAGTLEAGTNGVAVVIDTSDQPHSHALGCAAPANTLSVARIEEEVAADLLALKHQIESELGAVVAAMEA